MSDTPSEAEPRGSASKDSGVKPGIDAGEPEIPEAPKVPEGPADEVPAARTGGALSKSGSARGDSGGSGSGGTGSGGTDFEKRKAQARDVDTRDVDTPDLDKDEEWDGPVVESWFADVQAKPPAPIRDATLWAALATGVLSMLLLGDGLALNLLLVAIPAALGAYYAAQAAGRRPHRWTLVWGVGGLALLSVPALRDADWPSFLAVLAAVAAGSLALHGGRTWTGVLFGPIGLYTSLVTGPVWGWSGLRERSGGARGNVGPVVRAIAVAAVLLVVFGALFAGADAAFADLLGGLVPDASVSGGPGTPSCS